MKSSLRKLFVRSRPPFQPPAQRRPGQALEEALDDRFFDATFGLALMLPGILAAIMAALTPAAPALALGVTFVMGAGLFLWSFPHVRPLAKGLHAERKVGLYLNRLERHGARVFHDLPGAGFNIDHLVLCRAGVFVIETK